MRICTIFIFVCLAAGIVPSFAVPLMSPRNDDKPPHQLGISFSKRSNKQSPQRTPQRTTERFEPDQRQSPTQQRRLLPSRLRPSSSSYNAPGGPWKQDPNWEPSSDYSHPNPNWLPETKVGVTSLEQWQLGGWQPDPNWRPDPSPQTTPKPSHKPLEWDENAPTPKPPHRPLSPEELGGGPPNRGNSDGQSSPQSRRGG